MIYKLELLTSWVMIMAAAALDDSPAWVKTMSYTIGSIAALTVIIRFFIDWKNGKFKK